MKSVQSVPAFVRLWLWLLAIAMCFSAVARPLTMEPAFASASHAAAKEKKQTQTSASQDNSGADEHQSELHQLQVPASNGISLPPYILLGIVEELPVLMQVVPLSIQQAKGYEHCLPAPHHHVLQGTTIMTQAP